MKRTHPPRIPREQKPFCYAAIARDAFAVCVAPHKSNTSEFLDALEKLKSQNGFIAALNLAKIEYVFDDVVLPHEAKRWRVCVNKAYRVWSGLQRLERLNRQDKNATLFNGQAA